MRTLLLVTFLLAALPVFAANSGQPNFLLIIADDCTYTDLGTYGGQAKTPHLDRLASEGMKFSHCFQAAPMCSPTRHCLYTGLYPVKSGAYPNHTYAYDWVKSIAHYLQAAGYTTHLSGKTHINPESVFPFQYSRLPGDGGPDPAAFEQVLKSSTTAGQPFLFIAASNEPHGPYTKGDPSAYPPALLKLPPVLVDTEVTRQEFSKYLAEITVFDTQVGELVALVDKHGLKDNTLVIVLSEQGNSFPFAKWTCYDVGLRSACIARWPGHIASASHSSALVEYVDVVPTFMEAAGLKRPQVLDGRSFLPVLQGQAASHKEHVYGLQTTRGINNGSEWYGVRSVRDGRYRYIRNLTPEATFACVASQDAVFDSWRKRAQQGDEHAQTLVNDYQHRPAEELYDCESDPWNRRNLISHPELASVRDALRKQLDAWMSAQGDEGQATEMKALERMPRAETQKADKKPKKKKKKNKAANPAA